MDGVPNLTPEQLNKVRDSKEIHRRGRALLYAVMSRGGIGVLEQPPGSLAWLHPRIITFSKASKDTWHGQMPASTAKTGQKPGVCEQQPSNQPSGRSLQS